MTRLALLAILIASVTAVPANVLPVTLGLLTERYDLTPTLIGYLVAANTLAGLLTSLSAPWWAHRLPLRPLVGGLLVAMALGLVALGRAPSLPVLFGVQILLGMTAVGIASICVSVIARLDNPARGYGLKITADVILAGTFLALVPVDTLTLETNVQLLAAPFLLAIPLVAGLNASLGDDHGTVASVPTRAAPVSAWLVLASMVVFYVAGAGLWPFLERLGLEAGLDQGAAADLIAVGLFVGMVGSLGAVAVSGRVNGIWPQALCGLLFTASLPGLAFADSLSTFAAAVFVYNAAWNFYIPFVVALVAARDTSRRLGALVPGTAMLGGIIGPPLAGNLIEFSGYRTATVVMFGVAAVAVLGYVVLARRRPF